MAFEVFNKLTYPFIESFMITYDSNIFDHSHNLLKGVPGMNGEIGVKGNAGKGVCYSLYLFKAKS